MTERSFLQAVATQFLRLMMRVRITEETQLPSGRSCGLRERRFFEAALMARQMAFDPGLYLLPDRMVSDLIRVSEAPLDQLRAVATALRQEAGVLSGRRLANLVESVIHEPPTAQAVGATIYSLTPDRIRRTLDDLSDYRKMGLAFASQITDDVLANLRPRLEVLVGDYPALVRLRKAERLERRTGNWCDTIDVLSDLRPVFDPNRTQVEGLVLIQTLRLGYTDQEGNARVVTLGLDDHLFGELVDKLEIGRRKAALLRKTCDRWLPGGWAGPEMDEPTDTE